MAPEKNKSKIEENFFSTVQKIENQVYVFNFVMEHLKELKIFVRNKIAWTFWRYNYCSLHKSSSQQKCLLPCKHKVVNFNKRTIGRWNFQLIDQMNDLIKSFSRAGNGFFVQNIDHLDMNINRFKLFGGRNHIPTPAALVGNKLSFEYLN